MRPDFRITESNWRAVISNYASPTRSSGGIYPSSFLIISAGRLGLFYKDSEYHDLFWHKLKPSTASETMTTISSHTTDEEGNLLVVRFKSAPVIEYIKELKDRSKQKSLKETLLHISTLHEDMYKAEEHHIDTFLAYELLKID